MVCLSLLYCVATMILLSKVSVGEGDKYEIICEYTFLSDQGYHHP